MPDLYTVDSPNAAATLRGHLAAFVPQYRIRGGEYFRAGQVQSIARFDDRTLLAEVRGTQLYTVRLLRAGAGWRDTCSCPLQGGCKHVAATALSWLSRIETSPLPPATPPKLTFRQQWEPILAEKLGRPLAPEEGVFLGKLSQIFHNFRQAGRVHSHDLLRLGFHSNETSRGHSHIAFENWWTTPPRDPLELWQYIAYDLEASGLPVPEFMRPLTDTAPLRPLLQNKQRREAIARWNDRFNRLIETKTNADLRRERIPELEGFELQLRIGVDLLQIETRPGPDAPWKNALKSVLETFCRDDLTALSRLDTTPAVYAFLAICQKHFRYSYSITLKAGENVTRMWLHQVITHRLARTLVVTTDGSPLTFSREPLTWNLTRAASRDADYQLALQLPDGRALPPSALYLPGAPELYLHNGVVYEGPPALDGVSATAALVPAEAVEQPRVLQALRQYGTALPEEITQRLVTLPLRARLECALDVDFSGQELLTLLLHAVYDEPAVLQTWSDHGWVSPREVPPAAGANPSGPIISYDFSAPHQVAAQLRDFKLVYDFYQHRWTRRVTKLFPEEFVAWRESLGPGVEVLATGELASLLQAPVRANVDFTLLENNVHRDWFDLALALKPEDSTLTPEEITLLLKARGKLVRLPGKGWRRLTVHLDEAAAGALESAGFDPTTIAEAALAGESHRFHALQLAQSAVAELLPERQAADLRSRARELARPTPPALPAGLRAELRPYQIEGFHFLAFLSANRLGGVLADDMGLGKTVQTLAWLLWLSGQQPAGEPLRTLVVCPKSVVGNWEAETARFAPEIATVRYAPGALDATEFTRRPHLVIANYTQLRLGADYFTQQRWHAVILDEGQFIKSPSSKVAQVARDLPGPHRLILTGTPIENRLLDLWSLFAFALPGLLGPQAVFKRQYGQENPLALARLRTRVRHFLLRRTKAQVASDLPARTEEDVVVELDGDQAKLYQAELKRARAQLLKVETARQFDKARFNILASLLRLRQICCHPALIDPSHRDATSAKLEELLDRLEELRAEGHQVLVFSQFVTMLEIIRGKLVAAGIEHLMLTGQTEDRDALVRRFQTEKRHTVFLLSLKAAGFGLNLTAASYAILYDPWWNPAVEAQAIDRTHRIGQSMPVTAYRLIARGTVEEKIRALQREKSTLASAIVQEESLASVLDLDSLREILG